MYKINSLRNMRFAEAYSKWTLDQENLRHYKLKYAAQLGEDVERLAFNYNEKDSLIKNGLLSGVYNKPNRKFSDSHIL
jgi:hypothetical protein